MSKAPLPKPSRWALNAGIVVGGVIGFWISQRRGSDNVESFIITGLCCLVGAALFIYAELWLRRR